MANIVGVFIADGVSLEGTGFIGNCDFSLTMNGGNHCNIFVEVSYDSGSSWFSMTGGEYSESVDAVLLAGAQGTIYRLRANGVVGSVPYFLGQ